MNKCLVALIAVLIIVGCKNKTPHFEPVKRTVLVYAVANNSLWQFIDDNIKVMQVNFNPDLGARLLVFYNQRGGKCSLLEIERLAVGDASKAKVLAVYGENTDPSLASTLNKALVDVRTFAPADSYSLVMSSHGSGWLPIGMHPAKVAPAGGDAASYSFGGTTGFSTEMEIIDMAEALPSDMVFDVVAFDACYMASVEIAYEFRHKTRYVVGSAAEILGAGFPYKEAMVSLLTANAEGLARDFYNYYNAQTGANHSATIATIKCAELEGVAKEMAALVAQGGNMTAQQQFGRNLGRSFNYTNLIWDLGDMVHRTWGKTPAFDAALERAVVYQKATPILFAEDLNGEITVDTHCGLTVYIPRLSQPKTMEIYERDYAWAKDAKLARIAR